ncbi:MAG TPA: uroporphyrinogen-III synthase [Solimonas sp.]|nr:uroporphyrinogen-III synthase [Solimonas sp.]
MSDGAPLRGLRVLVTRPAAQAETLCRLLEARGATPLRLPLQSIEPVRQPAAAARALTQARTADAWLFTSTNAVLHARRLDNGCWPRTIAVGAATAAALRQLGCDVDLPDGASTSEAVLALPALRDVAGRRYAIVTGEGGRDALESTLRARGADVEVIAVYRRVNLPHDPHGAARLVGDADVAIVTSGEALARLLALMPAASAPQLRRLPLVVPSRRVVEQARRLGFSSTPRVPDQVTDAACLRCLEDWRAECRS